MSNTHNFIESTAEGQIILYVKAFPKSKSNKIDGIVSGENGDKFLKIRVTEAPEDGKANKAIIKLLSKSLEISKSSFEVISGETSSKKKITIKTINSLDSIAKLLYNTQVIN